MLRRDCVGRLLLESIPLSGEKHCHQIKAVKPVPLSSSELMVGPSPSAACMDSFEALSHGSS
jgi:hypothetical protein